MANEYASLLPKLKACLAQIQQIFEEGEKGCQQKVVKIEEEKYVLYNVLQHRKDIEKEHAELKAENMALKEKISTLRIKSNETKSKLEDVEKKYESYRKSVAKKQSNWSHFLQVAQKECTCKFKDNMSKTKIPLYNPIIKINHVSNLFFKSPIKPKGRNSSSSTGEGRCAPVIFGMKEKSSCLYFETDSSDNESDEEWLTTPALFTDNEIKMMTETPKPAKPQEIDIPNEKHLIQSDSCDPSPSCGLLSCDSSAKNTDVDINDESSHQSVPSNDDNNMNLLDKELCGVENEDTKDEITVIKNHPSSNLGFQTENILIDDDNDNNQSSSSSNIIEVVDGNNTSDKVRMKNYRNVFMPNRKFIEISHSIRKKRKTMKITNGEIECKNEPGTSNQSLGYTLKRHNSDGKECETQPMDADVKYESSTIISPKSDDDKSLERACDGCKLLYQNQNLTEDELKEILNQCAIHKHLPSPAQLTPDDFWSLDFSPMPTYLDEG